jgi:tetratricopeptide (TPR) repeat protein
MPTPIYRNFRDFLASAWYSRTSIISLVDRESIGIRAGEVQDGGTPVEIWHRLLIDHSDVIMRIAEAAAAEYTNQSNLILDLAQKYDPASQDLPQKILWENNPYVGLQPITDPKCFFGRAKATADLLQLTEDYAFVTIYGTSGSGKSSLLKAGVLPAWKKLPSTNGFGRMVIYLTPGDDPFDSLQKALGHHPDIDQKIKDAKEDKVPFLFEYIRDCYYPKQVLLVIIDQAEQLFHRENRLTKERSVQQKFISLLLQAYTTKNLRFIIGMRDDYYSDWTKLLRPEYQGNQYYLNPPDESDLRDIILLPARNHGVAFEAGLAEELIERLSSGAATLPLLQYLLQLLWIKDQPRDGILNWSSYRLLGRVEGVIGEQIKKFIERYRGVDETLWPQRDGELRGAFLSLVRFDRRNGKYHAVARPCAPEKLPANLVNPLKSDEYRLLTSEKSFVIFSHEAVIHKWPLYTELMSQLGEILATHDDLTEDAELWLKETSRGKRRHRLWTGYRLDRALELAGRGPHVTKPDRFLLGDRPLGKSAENFLDAGARSRKHASLLLTGGILALAILTVFSLGAAAWALKKQKEETLSRQKKDQMLQFVLHDLRSELEKSSPLSSVEFALEELKTVLSIPPDADEILFAQSLEIEQARLLFFANRREDALLRLEGVLKNLGEDAENEREHSLQTRVRARILAVAGDLYAWDRERLSDAESSCRRSISIWEKLLQEFPKDADTIISLAESRVFLGDALRELQKREDALVEFEQAQLLLDALESDGDSLGRDGLLAKAARRMGEIYFRENRLHEAEESFRKALKLAEDAISSGEDRIDYAWRESRAITWNRLGDTIKASDRKQAADFFKRSYAELSELVALHPENAPRRWELAVALRKAALEEPHTYRRRLLMEARNHNEALLNIDSKNTEWKSGMATTLMRLAEAEPNPMRAFELLDQSEVLVEGADRGQEMERRILLRKVLEGRHHNAGKNFQKAVDVLGPARSKFIGTQQPDNLDLESRGTLAWVEETMADALADLGSFELANEMAASVVKFRGSVEAPSESDLVMWIVALQRQAKILWRSSEYDCADDCYEMAFKLIERLDERAGDSLSYADLRGDLHLSRGAAFTEAGSFDAALEEYRISVTEFNEALSPNILPSNESAVSHRKLAVIHQKTANLLGKRGEVDAALAERANAVRAYIDYLFATEDLSKKDIELLLRDLAPQWYSQSPSRSKEEQLFDRLVVAQELERLAKQKSGKTTENLTGLRDNISDISIFWRVAIEARLAAVNYGLANPEITSSRLSLELATVKGTISKLQSYGTVIPDELQSTFNRIDQALGERD